MQFANEDEERDAFALFGDIDDGDEAAVETTDDSDAFEEDDSVEIEGEAPIKVKTGFSWAGFLGGVAAFTWIAGAIGGPLSYFGWANVMAMDPAMQAGLVALAFGPALLFWVTASAAGEALKARRLAAELTRMAYESRTPFDAGESNVRRLGEAVKSEIDTLNDAVTAAFDRLAQLEGAAERNAALFKDAVLASHGATEHMVDTLKRERDALVDISCDMRGQTETMANAVGRQVRLMREASKLVKTELGAAEDALETHLSSFASAATLMGERTADFQAVADDAAAATSALNTTMHTMLEGLGEATRLTDAARQSADQAVIAANETANSVRETTRSAVFEAKRAAQLIRAEAASMQESAAETLAKMREAAQAAHAASDETHATAAAHAASIERRLQALASSAAPAKNATRMPERRAEAHAEPAPSGTLRAAADAALARSGARNPRAEAEPKRLFKAFNAWSNFMPQPSRQEETPEAANESYELAAFDGETPDATLQHRALDLVCEAGVDLDDVLKAAALERVAASARNGAGARRRTVSELAPTAVNRIARHVQRNTRARDLAAEFRARPDLTKSEHKGEGSDLVRAYLLIDAALA